MIDMPKVKSSQPQYAADDIDLHKYRFDASSGTFFHKKDLHKDLVLKPVEIDLSIGSSEGEVGISPEETRLLLDKFSSQCAEHFAENLPKSWRDALLVSAERSEKLSKPRFEVRTSFSGRPLNIAMSFKSPDERNRFFSGYSAHTAVKGGTHTVEVGVNGTNKATVLHYLQYNLDKVFPHLDIKSDPKPIMIADFDGTLTIKPSWRQPREMYLKYSPACPALYNYLEKGGLLVINSGNSPQRIYQRLIEAFSGQKKNLLQQVAIAASGGHILFKIGRNGEPQEISKYLGMALKAQQLNQRIQGGQAEIPSPLVITIGDDGKRSGNDYPIIYSACRGICVSAKAPEEIAPELRSRLVPGGPEATAAVLTQMTEELIHGCYSNVVTITEKAQNQMIQHLSSSTK